MATTRKKVLMVEESGVDLIDAVETTLDGDNLYFDNTSTLFTADNVQDALNEVIDVVENGFDFSNATDFEVFNSDAVSSTTSGTFQDKTTGTTATDTAGTYVFQWSVELANSSNNQTTLFRAQYKQSSSGIWLNATDLDVFVGRSEVYQSTSGFRVISNPSTDTIDLRLQYASGGATARIRNASMYIFRVSLS